MPQWLLDLYAKHKEKIWATVFALGLGWASTQVSALFNSIPEVKVINDRLTAVEGRVTKIENDVYEVVPAKEVEVESEH